MPQSAALEAAGPVLEEELAGEAKVRLRRLAIACAVLGALAAGYLTPYARGALAQLQEPDALRAAILSMGAWGPLAVVALMALAIILSPIPSAPIALAAGTVYGHSLGTLYVLTGAELGALAALLIARLAGGAAVEQWLGRAGTLRLKGSQGTLMAIVFVTRLMPFLSFDAVSYAAGLTPLSFWRFAVATLVGIVPASFVLAHLGADLASADAVRVNLALVLFGLAVLVPLVRHLVRQVRAHRDPRPRIRRGAQ